MSDQEAKTVIAGKRVVLIRNYDGNQHVAAPVQSATNLIERRVSFGNNDTVNDNGSTTSTSTTTTQEHGNANRKVLEIGLFGGATAAAAALVGYYIFKTSE